MTYEPETISAIDDIEALAKAYLKVMPETINVQNTPREIANKSRHLR